jgi:branched-chain amino acid transport system permease protein
MDLKRDHFDDVRLLRTNVARCWFTLLLVGLALAPLVLPGYTLYTLNFIAVHVIIALGLNILTGYTGQISLGHAGFVAVGAYATVLLMTRVDVPFLLALPAAGLVAAAFGVLMGFPALRLEGPFLAVVTLGFGLAVTQVIGRWPLLGGRMGLPVPELTVGPFAVTGDRGLYAVIVPLTLLLAVAARNLMVSRVGRAFRAVRDSDIAAEAMGVHLARTKTLAFAISAFYAGVAGGLMAFVLRFLSPEQFSFVLSVLFLAMITVGGLGSIAGSVFGAVVVSLLLLKGHLVQEVPVVGDLLAALSRGVFTEAGLPNVSWVLTGLVLMLIVVLEPLGLYGLWLRTRRYWQTWPF